ncbi:MAG: RHS domain-containing protein [Gammaproteobacteria bacterium]
MSGGYPLYYPWSSVLGEPVVELTSGGVYRAYVYGPSGQMLALQSADANFYWAHTDHLGSGRKLTNTSGTVVYRAEYDPYGQALYEWASGGATFLSSHKFGLRAGLGDEPGLCEGADVYSVSRQAISFRYNLEL